MNSDEIKLDITEQISKTNDNLSNYFGTPWFKGIFEEDVDSLTKVHKKVTRYYNLQLVMSVLLSGIFLIIFFLNFLEILHKDLNKAGLLILFIITYLLGFYRYYKIKVNLEHKIYLLGLRNKIDDE
jgi:hypothetical protein